MITRIEASRYRCFQRLELDVHPYQVLVGRNGAGKSTLLDIPIVLGEVLEDRSIENAFFGDRGGFAPRASTASDLITFNRGDWFSLAVEVRLPEFVADQLNRKNIEYLSSREQGLLQREPGRALGALRYELGFRVTDQAISISHEYLFLLPRDRKLIGQPPAGLWGELEFGALSPVRPIVRRTVDACLFYPEVGRLPDSPNEEPRSTKVLRPTKANIPAVVPAVSGIPLDLDLYAATDWFRNYLGRDVLPVTLKLPRMHLAQRSPGAQFKVARDGSTLPWSILELQDKPDLHRQWLEHIQPAIPFLEDVRAYKRPDDNYAYIEVTYSTGHKVRSIGLSDGTLTLLALSILPFLENVPRFVAVEEPENGIHPKAIEVILESLQNMEKSQAWVTTHSPIVVSVTDLDDLLCLSMTKSEGIQVIRGSEHPELANWKGTPTLDTLFKAGVL